MIGETAPIARLCCARLRGASALLIATLLALGVSASHTAAAVRMIPRAEKGSIPMILGLPVGLEHPRLVEPKAVAWTETARPALNVRLLDGSIASYRETSGVPAGAILFGHQLSSRVAYCPRIPYTAGVPEVQCFRDLDNDQDFDAIYVSDNNAHFRSHLLIGYVHELAGMPKIRFEPVGMELAVPIDTAMVYEGVRGRKLAFRMRVENEPLDSLEYCAPASNGDCDIDGLKLHITPQGDGVLVELVSAAPDREITIQIAGDGP